MSVPRWKVMACTLGLSLGGLAICAAQSNNRLNAPPTPDPADPPSVVLPQSPKPVVPSAAPDTLPPLQIPTPPAREIEIEIPSIVPVQSRTPEVPMVTAPEYPTTVPEKLPMPRELSDTARPRVVGAPPVVTPPVFETDIPAPPTPPQTIRPEERSPITPPPPVLADVPPTRTPPEPRMPSSPVLADIPPTRTPPDPRVPPPPPTTIPPSAPPTLSSESRLPQVQPPVAAATSRLKMLMRLGDGKPRFEIRTSDSVALLLKVYGEKIEMQSAPEGAKASPIAGVSAIGKVRFNGPGIEGTCDQLTVLSGTGEVMLKGNVHVKTKRGKTWNEMTTEKMIYQIGGSGLSTPGATHTPVRPTAYQEIR